VKPPNFKLIQAMLCVRKPNSIASKSVRSYINTLRDFISENTYLIRPFCIWRLIASASLTPRAFCTLFYIIYINSILAIIYLNEQVLKPD